MSPTSRTAGNERDPLLVDKKYGILDQSTSQNTVRGETPLPIRQLLILALVRLAEPINFTVIFPFVNQVCFCPYLNKIPL